MRDANPCIQFNLEVMTRDPLRVPVLSEEYWASMPNVPATELARTLRVVHKHEPSQPLERVTGLPPKQRVEAETRNIIRSFSYSLDVLAI